MLIIKIILGLIGLGIVVFVHELGHFLAARLVKIDVDAFSIGWGNPILKKKIGNVEYRLGMFPVGGYCKMKGDSDYNNEAYEKLAKGILPEKGSYLAASPLARILVSFSGPFFNLVFAVFLLSILWGIGFNIQTLENRIILASDITQGETFPADIAGLKTGDRIIEISGKEINYYHEVHENIVLNPEKKLPLLVERDGKVLELAVTPSLDKSSGAGKIGVYFWTDPVIASVEEGSPAQRSGLLPHDKIISANSIAVSNTMDLVKALEQNPELLVLEYNRDGRQGHAEFTRNEYENGIGLSWAVINYRTPNLSIPAAIAKGVGESWKTLIISVKSLGLLFKGIDLTQAVSGPVRITYMIGEMAAQGFGQGIGMGFRSIAEFLALISIALCIMNLLPLPILDGGMIILFLFEFIRRKPAHPKAIAVFQSCGMVIIFGLMIFALFGDIMFFVRN
ncbi:MAG: site-2 protease family protein [Treponema sp.]|nr:site-2 protease family protein [Treponema sp.]MCL2271361.1 site-2 protease family protein [Treponema sp.]